MVRNLRVIFARAGLTEQEVRTLRGVVTALSKGRGGCWPSWRPSVAQEKVTIDFPSPDPHTPRFPAAGLARRRWEL